MPHDPFDEERLTGERRRAPPSARELALRAELMHVRHELKALLAELDNLAKETIVPVQSAVVTAVVPKTILMQHHTPRRS